MSKTSSYRIKNEIGLYYLTFATIGWADVFTRKTYRDILIESLKFCISDNGLSLFADVVMSNHVYMVCRAEEDSHIVRSAPGFGPTTKLKRNQIATGS